MERIKKALEEARQAREEAEVSETIEEQLATVSESTPAQESTTVSPTESATASTEKVTTGKIAYTQTRQIVCDPAVMEANRLISGIGQDGNSAAYKMLRTQVLQAMSKNDWKALAVSSPGAGEGKTLTAINLAISLAQEVQHTVLLVDFDLSRPSVHKAFGFQPEFGISDFVHHDISLDKVLVNPGIESLVVLPGKESIQNSSEILSSPQIVGMVEELKTRYPKRVVIFDLPPILQMDDALAFSPYVDAFLLVVGETSTKRNDVKKALHLLKSTNLIGTVLNKADEKIKQR